MAWSDEDQAVELAQVLQGAGGVFIDRPLRCGATKGHTCIPIRIKKQLLRQALIELAMQRSQAIGLVCQLSAELAIGVEQLRVVKGACRLRRKRAQAFENAPFAVNQGGI
ncbi:hypothetical protein D3C77_570910 [compost metagenome]